MGRASAAFLMALIPAFAWAGSGLTGIVLDQRQSEAFRQWFVRMITEQFRQGPSPRWIQRDCAGLVRFAAVESLKNHDASWLKANGLLGLAVPPEVNLKESQRELLDGWKQAGTENRNAYASAYIIIQENSRFLSKDINRALPGDLLFFDQGEDQHLMVWAGSFIVYHTGTETKTDTGLRKVKFHELMNWKDTRWQPRIENPNFIGIYRFSFLPSAP